MQRFLDNPKLYTFECDDEVVSFVAYTSDGAANIASRLFRGQQYQLVQVTDYGTHRDLKAHI
jgi:hypothetical protein